MTEAWRTLLDLQEGWRNGEWRTFGSVWILQNDRVDAVQDFDESAGLDCGIGQGAFVSEILN